MDCYVARAKQTRDLSIHGLNQRVVLHTLENESNHAVDSRSHHEEEVNYFKRR
jgi:hypothetical protein